MKILTDFRKTLETGLDPHLVLRTAKWDFEKNWAGKWDWCPSPSGPSRVTLHGQAVGDVNPEISFVH